MTILVVDDEISFRFLMRNLLRDKGHEVVLAEDGEDALKKLGEAKVDIIISDVYMPVMDGFRLHRAVRSNPAFEKIPFLFVSGYDDQYTQEAVKDSKVDGFVRKGAPVQELLDRIAFLTLPEEQRSIVKPESRPKTSRDDWRDRRGGGKTPIY